jgi:alpha-beta hydrolase superfamily lysophospholipase
MSQPNTEDSREFFFEATDQEKIYTKAWLVNRNAIRGIIQIAHGLGETADYYTDFSQRATQAGFAVYILEARGHGRTAGDVQSPEYNQKGGDIGDGGFEQLRDDQYSLTKLIKAEFPGVPLFLLGHSMGAVVARLYAFVYGAEIDGLILTGASSPSHRTDALLQLIEQEIAEKGLKTPSQDTFEVMFSKLNTAFEPIRTPLDWITSDNAMIDYSLQQPYTYILFNNQFYRFSFLALKEADNPAKIPAGLPVYLLSGNRDIITDKGKATVAQAERYKSAGVKDVEYKLYPNVRHSILREVNRAEVSADIFDWIAQRL